VTQASSALARQCTHVLSAEGDLPTRLPGFVPRAAQQQLSATMAETIVQREVLLAEAGTGTGKTYAYLVPVLLSGTKTIISTATRALQDQLYHRDLPQLRQALGSGGRSALLKGRANYLCHDRLDRLKGEPQRLGRGQTGMLQRIVAWAGRTQMGDLAELDGLPEDSPLPPLITSTAENCLGKDCPFWAECFVVKARQRAQAADLVVVNHHLLLADLALKQEGFGDILPGAQAFVIDEAHRFPELAGQFFGERLSARPLVELARDALTEAAKTPAALALIQAPAQQLEHAVRHLRAEMEALPQRGSARQVLEHGASLTALTALATALETLETALDGLHDASPGLEHCQLRARLNLARLARWCGQEAEDAPDSHAEAPPEAVTVPASVRWYELSPRGFGLQATPLDVSSPLRAHRERSNAAWIFTSATLAVSGHFDHFARRLGLIDPPTLLVPSPFDWPHQALCYLPSGLPLPASPDYPAALHAAIVPVLNASGGRAFVLFSSHRVLWQVAAHLREAHHPWPLFVQGEAPRSVLLQRFRDSGNGVLLGAASFREGVDVAGDALSVVVIDKLPFAAPDDPVFQAQLEAITRAGGDPFMDEQLPQAVIALKQGVGRLIRSERDRGVLVLCDPRLTRRGYGRIFLDSLPPVPRTQDAGEVQRFFAEAGSSTLVKP